jgi:hypothetical protein
MLFRPAYPKDLTNDLTKPVTVALNRPAFLDFFWQFTTNTNAGRCFVIAILALGFFSSLGIVFAALPIGSIPIVGYILSFVTGIGSFGALFVMMGIAVPVVYTYFKKRDIWAFPSVITSGLKMITRCGVALDLLKQINWSCLELEKAGSNVKQIFDDLTSALATRTVDKGKYGNAPIKYVGKLLAMKELPQILGTVIRAVDAILRLRRQENFSFAVVERYDLLLCLLQHLKDYIIGNLDEAIGQNPTPYISGITHTILKVTDGKMGDLNDEYKTASTQHLIKSVTSSVQQSRQLGKVFSFPVDREKVTVDPTLINDNRELNKRVADWRANVEVHIDAVKESFAAEEIELSQKIGLELHSRYGLNDGVKVELPVQNLGGIELPDEAVLFLKTHPDMGKILGVHFSGKSEQVELSRGSTLPSAVVSNNPGQTCWWAIEADSPENDNIKTFFMKFPEDVHLNEGKEWYHIPVTWILLRIKLEDTTQEIALPIISMLDTNGNIWLALAWQDNQSVVPASEWIKFDPTNPEETAAALCEAATEKPLSEKRKEEAAERERHRARAREFTDRIEKIRRKRKAKRPT